MSLSLLLLGYPKWSHLKFDNSKIQTFRTNPQGFFFRLALQDSLLLFWGPLVGLLVFSRGQSHLEIVTSFFHVFFYFVQAAFLYVDHGLGLLTHSRRITLDLLRTMFLCALCVLLSQERISFGQKFIWLGWQLDLCNMCVTLPSPPSSRLFLPPGPSSNQRG